MLSAFILLATLAGPVRPLVPAILDTAIARMGGRAKLEAVTQVRLEYVTQWFRTSFEDNLFGGPVSSFETNVDLRDYAKPAWRYTRSSIRAGGAPFQTIDIVSDSAAAFMAGTAKTWAPLSVAYVDERSELFMFSPERVLLTAGAATDLHALADTVEAGARHARIAGTSHGIPFVLWINRATALPRRVDYTAEQPNDFGLAGWGPMRVSLLYSRWSRMRNGIAFPSSIDIARVGKPYKRISLLAVDLAATLPADSFMISDSVRTEFFRTQNRAMQDLPLDSARVVEDGLVQFGTPGAPTGAVRVGTGWWLLEAGVSGYNAERAASWVRTNIPQAKVAGAFVSSGSATGGISWLAGKTLPIVGGPGAQPFVETMLRNRALSTKAATTLRARHVYAAGADSLIVMPVDLPDSPGALLVYSPRMHWLYGPLGGTIQLEAALRTATAEGWQVDWVGIPGRIKTATPKV